MKMTRLGKASGYLLEVPSWTTQQHVSVKAVIQDIILYLEAHGLAVSVPGRPSTLSLNWLSRNTTRREGRGCAATVK